MCHNGEINTFKGNISRMKSREELFESTEISDDDMKKILPIIVPKKSDSASMDMVVELLLMTGRSLPEVMMMLVPEAWEKHNSMDKIKKHSMNIIVVLWSLGMDQLLFHLQMVNILELFLIEMVLDHQDIL